jgi:hypothetical protein
MVSDLALELLGDRIERRSDLLRVRRRSEGLARGVERDLHVVRAAEARVLLKRDLDRAAGHLVLEPSQPLELVLGHRSDLVSELLASTLQHQLHARSFGRSAPSLEPGRGKWARARLTWSLAPHSPAEGITALRVA